MHLRPALLAAVVAATPPAARAQAASPYPFVGPTQAFAVSGCGAGVRGGPPFTTGPALCAAGAATLGTVLPSSGIPFYQVTLDLTLDRQPGFAPPVTFESGAFAYSVVSRRTGATLTTPNDPFFTATIAGSSFTTRLLLLTGAPAADVVPNSLQFIPGSTLIFTYGDPWSTFDTNTTVIPLAFAAVPEPSTFALGAAGGAVVLAGVGARRRRAAV